MSLIAFVFRLRAARWPCSSSGAAGDDRRLDEGVHNERDDDDEGLRGSEGPLQ